MEPEDEIKELEGNLKSWLKACTVVENKVNQAIVVHDSATKDLKAAWTQLKEHRDYAQEITRKLGNLRVAQLKKKE